MVSSKQYLSAFSFATLLVVAQVQSITAATEDDMERPHHMKRKARFHRAGAKKRLESGTIDSTIDHIKSNQAHSGGGLRNARDRFQCNDDSEETLLGYKCNHMDQLSFISNAELGSRAATQYTKCSDDESELGFDYINDIWGYESQSSGKKYAIVGLWDGTSFVDITNLREPVVIGFLDMAGDLEEGNCDDGFWRDVKVVNDHAYIVAEPANSGIQIVDLKRLDDLPRPTGNELYPTLVRDDVPRIEADAYLDTFGAAHNLIPFEEEGKVLVVGYGKIDVATACDRKNGETVAVLDVKADPLNPPVDCLDLGSQLNLDNQEPYAQMNTYPGYVHDGNCFVYDGPDAQFRGTPICILFAETEIGIVNMSSGDMISTFSYDGATYVHQGWISDDFTTLYANDETDEECRSGLLDFCDDFNDANAHPSTRIFDIRSLENVGEAREFVNTKPHASIDHNMYVRGDYVFSANYEAGARVYKIQEDKSLKEVAYFDVSNDCDDIIDCADPFGGSIILIQTRLFQLQAMGTMGCMSFELDSMMNQACLIEFGVDGGWLV